MKAEHYVLVFGWGGQRYENSVGPDMQTSTLGLVMLDKHTGPEAAHGFNVPGGRVGYMEHSDQTAAREYTEETGIVREASDMHLFHAMIYPNGVRLDSFWTALAHEDISGLHGQSDVGDHLLVQRFWVSKALGMSPVTPMVPAGRWAKGMSYLVPFSFSCFESPEFRPQM